MLGSVTEIGSNPIRAEPMAGKSRAKPRSDAAPADDAAKAPTRAPLAVRLRAWWQGVDLVWPAPEKSEPELSVKDAPEEAQAEVEPVAAEAQPVEVWSANRRRVAQLIYGSGVLLPGGDDYVLNLVKTMGLNAQVTMLLFGAALGADARAIAKDSGVYVTGFEIDPSLVGVANDLTKVASLDKKVQIAAFDIDRLGLKKGFYQGALVRELLRALDRPERLIEEIGRALKSRGEMVIVDLFQAGAAPGPAMQAWIEREPAAVHPVTVKALEDELKKRGFSIRVSADESSSYVSMVTSTFSELVRSIARTPPPPELVENLIQETELWTHRLAAIAAGEVRYQRIAAIKK